MKLNIKDKEVQLLVKQFSKERRKLHSNINELMVHLDKLSKEIKDNKNDNNSIKAEQDKPENRG